MPAWDDCPNERVGSSITSGSIHRKQLDSLLQGTCLDMETFGHLKHQTVAHANTLDACHVGTRQFYYFGRLPTEVERISMPLHRTIVFVEIVGCRIASDDCAREYRRVSYHVGRVLNLSYLRILGSESLRSTHTHISGDFSLQVTFLV